jgi:hypothetical protein
MTALMNMGQISQKTPHEHRGLCVGSVPMGSAALIASAPAKRCFSSLPGWLLNGHQGGCERLDARVDRLLWSPARHRLVSWTGGSLVLPF